MDAPLNGHWPEHPQCTEEVNEGPAREAVDLRQPYNLSGLQTYELVSRPSKVFHDDLGRPLESVFINVGENGVFARQEFQTVTALGQMEFITPEEVADYVVMELEGRPTGRDIVIRCPIGLSAPSTPPPIKAKPSSGMVTRKSLWIDLAVSE